MPGFSEYEKHFSDFNKTTKRDSSIVDSMLDGIEGVGCMVGGLVTPIYDMHLQVRIKQDTKKLEKICEYAKVTGNRVWMHYSPKYENVPCYAFLLTDGETRLLIEGNSLISMIKSGVLVVDGCGLIYYLKDIVFAKKNDSRAANKPDIWIVPPIEFSKEQCSNIRKICKSMRQYLRKN